MTLAPRSGKRLRGCSGKKLKELQRLPKREAVDMDVCWRLDGQTLTTRLLLVNGL